jgi:hypothetical protein
MPFNCHSCESRNDSILTFLRKHQDWHFEIREM